MPNFTSYILVISAIILTLFIPTIMAILAVLVTAFVGYTGLYVYIHIRDAKLKVVPLLK